MSTIHFVNTSNYDTDTEVEVHRPDCQRIDTFCRNRILWADADAGQAELDTSREAWEEYNADFIAEAEAAGEPVETTAWPVTVYPCTGLVETRTTISK